MSTRKPLDNALIVWALAVGGCLAFDVFLCENDHESLSTHAGQHPYCTFGALLIGALHFNSVRLRPLLGKVLR